MYKKLKSKPETAQKVHFSLNHTLSGMYTTPDIEVVDIEFGMNILVGSVPDLPGEPG